MELSLGINGKGKTVGLYCSKKCAEEDNEYLPGFETKTTSTKEIEQDEETCLCEGEYHESDLGLWYSEEEGVVSPMFGSGCSNCDTPLPIL